MSLYEQPTFVRDLASSLPTAPKEGLDIAALVDELTNRITKAEKLIEQKVNSNSLAKILLTDKDLVLMGDRISLVGQVNMFDWVRDISGNPTGGIDPTNVSRVVGGKIQTGAISSTNWTTTSGSRIDLDNGTIVLGGSDAPKFSVTSAGVMSCTGALVTGTLQAGSIITNSVTVDGVSLATISTGAANGTTALSGLSAKLDNNAATVIASGFYLKTTNYDAGTGIAIYNGGIIGKSGGVNKFVLGSDGTATFSGTVSAGAITSSSYVDVSSYIKATGLETVSRAAIFADVSTTNPGDSGVRGTSSTGNGVFGYATGTNGVGVKGVANSSGYGVSAENVSGVALRVSGIMTKTGTELVANLNADRVDSYHAANTTGSIPISNGTVNTNLNADMLDGYHESFFLRYTGSDATGSTTYTLTGAPSGKTIHWANVSVGGVPVIIPYFA